LQSELEGRHFACVQDRFDRVVLASEESHMKDSTLVKGRPNKAFT
jgi:hypothetical protein